MRANSSSAHHGSLHLADEDSAIRGTNDEATIGKLSAVTKGYYDDAFVSAFGSKRTKPLVLPPLMNRGHFARSIAMETVVRRFLEPREGWPSERQVVSLGCGFDTLYFRLCASSETTTTLHYFEVDFEQVVLKKHRVLQEDPRFAPFLDPSKYSLFACDLRNTSELSWFLSDRHFVPAAPTLFLSECVLIYMSAEEGNSIIEWAAKLEHSVFCTYEQIRPHDAFGKTMIRNLEHRNIPLHSLLRFPELEDQEKRYKQAGFGWARARTMLDVFDRYLPQDLVRKACQIEFFDEFEEWQIVLSHYCLVVAARKEMFAF
jgi:O-methyltransferase involved in polyketide biosynthesis